jgi:hypothetical protein
MAFLAVAPRCEEFDMVHPHLPMSCAAFHSLSAADGVAGAYLHQAICNSAHTSLGHIISLLLMLGFASARTVGF